MTAKNTTVVTVEFESDEYQWARGYAISRGLRLKSVLNAALAEYAARRQQTQVGPEPQLHFRRGHPTAEFTRRQQQLISGSQRGRKLR